MNSASSRRILGTGEVEYFDEAGTVSGRADSASQRAAYLVWCREPGSGPAGPLA
jgi:hypothetical protein